MSDSRVDPTSPETELDNAGTARGGAEPDPGAALIAVFRLSSSHPVVLDGREVVTAVQELEDVIALVENEGVLVRGWYDVSGLRNDADLAVVLTGPAVEDLQWAVREIRRSTLLRPLIRSWSGVGFAAGADPFGGAAPRQWLTVSPAWPNGLDGLFDDEESDDGEWSAPDALESEWVRSEALGEAIEFDGAEDIEGDEGDIAVHHLAAFGLADDSWLLVLEADELYDLVSLVGDLTDDEEGPILDSPRYTGRLIEPAEIVEVLQ